jgi:hypothetical protein
MKKNFNRRKGKKLKEEKLVAGVLGVAMRCAIHGATVENALLMIVQILFVLLTRLKYFYI